jgi:O-antigen ligase
VLFIKYYPEIGRYYHRWTYQVQYAGVTTNKNSLGLLAMIGGLFLLWQIVDSKKDGTPWRQRFASVWPETAVFLACLWILNIANSATALGCFLLGVIVFLACRTFVAGLTVRSTVAIVGVVGLSGWLTAQTSVLRGLVAQAAGRDATLTERTYIWAEALALPTNPLIGAGFSSVWLTPEGWALRERIGGLAHAHNGYIESYLDGGAVGVALLIAVVLLAVIQAGRHLSANTPGGAFYVAFVLVGIVYNFTEVTFNRGNAVGLLMWLIALSHPDVVLVRREVSRLHQGRRPWQRVGPVRRNLDVPRRSSRAVSYKLR